MHAQTIPTKFYHTNQNEHYDILFNIIDAGSAASHFIGFVLSILTTPLILIHASDNGAVQSTLIGLSIFMLSMILLYGASTAYHTFNISKKANLYIKRMDHMSIFILIAGSNTPLCLTTLKGSAGIWLLSIIWGLAVIGMIFKFIWVTCPKWVSSVIYIIMGWVCILALPQLLAGLSVNGFLWLLAGGLFYTVGGIIYALKFPVFHNRFPNFGCHELFHVFVLAGSFCHFIVMYAYLT